MAEMGYESNPGYWEHKREKAESLIYGYHFTKDGAEKAVSRMLPRGKPKDTTLQCIVQNNQETLQPDLRAC